MKLSEILEELDFISKRADAAKILCRTDYQTAIENNIDQIKQSAMRIKASLDKF